MVGDNRILTVSYGTFSCTLEGFEDPFSTMKAIAEYFRDLAAEDRFFGAEPPQPDTERLHAIAEQTIQARVSAEVKDNSLVLRQASSDEGESSSGAVAGLAASGIAAAVSNDDTVQEEVSDEVSSDDAETAEVSVEELEAALEASEHSAGDDTAFSQPDIAADIAAEEYVASDDESDDVSAFFDANPVEEEFDLAESSSLADIEMPSEGDEGTATVAEKLARIRDAVAKDGLTNGFTEDEHAEPAAESDDEETLILSELADADEKEAEYLTDDVTQPETGVIERESVEVELVSREDVETAVSESASDEEDYAQLASDDLEDEEIDLDQLVDEVESQIEPEALNDEDADDEVLEATAETERATLAFETEDEDAALERIMDEADVRLDESEGNNRRASIAHLKAAVAATKADSSLTEGDKEEEERELDQYREDLARVVRKGSDEHAEEKPTPLVLVSEQRIDDEDDQESSPASVQPVRPRRVTQGNLAVREEEEEVDLIGDDEAFIEYASNFNATELPDLLEAAAAHVTYNDGIEFFTRPMLMRKIAPIAADQDISREDGLRAFGSLLRTGRIIRHTGNGFAIAPGSRFAPEAQSSED